jgi:hypothetical protein
MEKYPARPKSRRVDIKDKALDIIDCTYLIHCKTLVNRIRFFQDFLSTPVTTGFSFKIPICGVSGVSLVSF